MARRSRGSRRSRRSRRSRPRKLKLVSLEKSDKYPYKFTACFDKPNGRTSCTHFGHRDYEDYTIHGDRERRDRYIDRHAKDLRTRNPTRAGFLSMFILWNKPTVTGSLRDFRRRLKDNNWTLPT